MFYSITSCSGLFLAWVFFLLNLRERIACKGEIKTVSIIQVSLAIWQYEKCEVSPG